MIGPKLVAVVIALAAWELVARSGWRPDYLLPGPAPVLGQLAQDMASGAFWHAVAVTMSRASIGYLLALGAGVGLGAAVAQVSWLRASVGSLITGVQSMPSITWFPFAIMVFGLGEPAILFVVLLGAAPAIAAGLITGFDHIQPLLLRAGRSLGARRWQMLRHVILPAALPSFVGGLKQGWAFAWRSLMAGELIVIVANRPSLGLRLANDRELFDMPDLLATMLAVLIIGMLVDAGFSRLDYEVRLRWGLVAD